MGCDHAGYPLKEALKAFLEQDGGALQVLPRHGMDGASLERDRLRLRRRRHRPGGGEAAGRAHLG